MISILLLFSAFTSIITTTQVSGHGYILYPKSRNYYWGVGPEFPSSIEMGGAGNVPNLNADISAGTVGMSIEQSLGHELCGDTALLNRFTNASSPYSSTPIQAVVTAGSTFDIQIQITVFHLGWFEFRLCTSFGAGLTQDCLNEHVLELDTAFTATQYSASQMPSGVLNPLDYIGINSTDYALKHTQCDFIPAAPHGSCCYDGGNCSPPTQNNNRWMVPNPSADAQPYTIRVIIPAGISCDRCVLQWFYQTGNSPDNYPEGFWNCADIQILPSDATASPTILQTTNVPTQPTTTSTPTIPATGGPLCSGVSCPDTAMCRSEWGYCGTGSAYCNSLSIWTSSCNGAKTATPTTVQPTPTTAQPTFTTTQPTAPAKKKTAKPTSPTTAAPTQPTSKPAKSHTSSPTTNASGSVCSGASCPSPTMCRSQWGFCGTGSAYCNAQSTWISACSGEITVAPSTTQPTTIQPKSSKPTKLRTSTPTTAEPTLATPQTSSPTMEPTNGATQSGSSCSGAPCPDTAMCRSQWGYCGTGTAYCNSQSTWTDGCVASAQPTTPTTNAPTVPPMTSVPTVPTTMPSTAQAFFSVLEAKASALDAQFLLYQTPALEWEQSTIYHAQDLITALKVMVLDGVDGDHFYVGDDVGLTPSQNAFVGLVGLAAFLAQAKEEAIMYDACDENNWDLFNGEYPLSNACGQLGQSYQNYTSDHPCPLNPQMSIVAVTNAQWYGAPAPFFCAPLSQTGPTGYWDFTYQCNQPWAVPPQTCNIYPGQQAGGFVNTTVAPNRAGRTDVENCCWWGRGVIQTTGPGNYGELNYFLGAGAAARGAPSSYPGIDFCKTPEAICSSTTYPELKWIAGLFYWLNSVQSYNSGGWDYLTELKAYVASGLPNPGTDTGFIDSISAIVNRGCALPPCPAGPVADGSERASNFQAALQTLGLIS